jgi:hypothetical protein
MGKNIKWIPTRVCLGTPSISHIYKNDLPNNVEQIGVPILFADDASILISHSALNEFNKKLNMVFKTLMIDLQKHI